MSDWTAGAEYSRKALESAQAVVAADPEETWWRKKLAIDYDTVATSMIILGDQTAADANHREAMVVRQALLISEPADAENQRNVAVSHRMLGDRARHGHSIDAIRAHYENGLLICEQLAAADPGSHQKQGDVLDLLGVLTDACERAERFDEGLEWVEKTARRLDQLTREKQMSRAVLESYRAIADTRRAVYRAAAHGLKLEATSEPVGAPADLAPAMYDWWTLLPPLGWRVAAATPKPRPSPETSSGATPRIPSRRSVVAASTPCAQARPRPERAGRRTPGSIMS